MTLHDLLKARFTMVRQDFESVLARISDEDLHHAPGQGMRTIAGQLLEIADKERETLKWLLIGVWPDDDPPSFDVETANLAEIRAVFNSLREATYAYIDARTEAELRELMPCEEGWWEALRMTACPKDEILRNIAAHEWYHTGQLVTYLWLRGDDPYFSET